jgi:hypothetical protein
MTKQIRLCLPARWGGIRSATALRISQYDKQGHVVGRLSISEKKKPLAVRKSNSFIRTASRGTFRGNRRWHPQCAVRLLIPRLRPCIISLGSKAGQIGLAAGAPCGVTKATLAAMTRSWAAEFSPSGVRVNAIAAGPVLTNGAAPDRIEALGATTLVAGPPIPPRSPA